MAYYEFDFKIIMILFSLILFSGWTIRFAYKIFDNNIKRYVLGIGGLLFFWLMARLVHRYNDSRIFWYLYYVALIFVPSLYYILSRYLTGRKNYKISYTVMTISTVLLILVLTNDFHNIVFRFYDDDYKNVAGYYIIFLWIIILTISSTINLVIKKRSEKRDINVFVPFIPIIIGILYTFFYINNILSYIQDIDMSTIIGIIFLASLEMLFAMELIPNNVNYEDVFTSSYLPVLILSSEGEILYETNNIVDVPDIIISDIKKGQIKDEYKSWDNKYIIYQVESLDNGYSVIKRDYTNLEIVREKLSLQNKKLIEQEKLLKKQRRIKEKLYEIKINNEIFENLSRRIEGKRKRIEDIIEVMHKPDVAGLNEIKLLVAYCKRMSNLIVSNYNNEIYDADKISVIFNELLTDSEFFGIHGVVNTGRSVFYESKKITSLYDIIFSLFYNTRDTDVLINITKSSIMLSFDRVLMDMDFILKDII